MTDEPKLLDLWIKALRGDDYDQTDGTLRDRDGYCCLGVVCDLHDPSRWQSANDQVSFYYLHRPNGSQGSGEFLPGDVRDLLGLEKSGGDFEFDDLPAALRLEIAEEANRTWAGQSCSLVDLNDNKVPFPLIAKVIAARPKGLFKEVPA